jgi:ADP-heptose:LPS heptosyltransferase
VEAIDQPADRLPALDLGPWELEEPPQIVPTPDEQAEVDDIVRQVAGAAVGPIVLLNPNSGDLVPLRRWPTERYVALARHLLAARPDVTVLVTGAPSEADAAAEVVRAIGHDRCASIAGRTTMRQLLVLYARSEVLVTNDSGPAHYATLTPIDVVVLFGPETPQVFGPVSARSHHVWAGLACSPCVNAYNNRLSPCTDNLCMQRIGTDEVLEQVLAVLDRRRPAGA